MKSINDVIATKPFDTTATKAKVNSGVAVADTKTTLQALVVVFDSVEIKAGSLVYVDSDSVNRQAWARKIYTIKDKNIILVPLTSVILVEE